MHLNGENSKMLSNGGALAGTPRITCYRELGGSGNSEVNNGRQIRLGAVFILFYS